MTNTGNTFAKTPENSKYMFKSTGYILAAITFAAGLLLGSLFSTAGVPVAHTVAQQVSPEQVEAELAAHVLDVQKNLQTEPDNPQHWIHLGNLYFDAHKPEQAIPAYEKALELQPDNANVHTDLGTMYRAANQPEKAVAQFEKAISLQADHQNARFNKGLALIFDLDKLEEGVNAWRALIALHPGFTAPTGETLVEALPEVVLQRAASLEKAEKKAEALVAYSLALELQPQNQDALLHKGQLLESLGRSGEAQEVWKTMVSIDPKATNHSNVLIKDLITAP